MLQHVYERASQARYLTSTIIATDDREVQSRKKFGAPVRMTRPDHVHGTDRVAEAASAESVEIIVNIQGDEPLIDPAAIDTAILPLVDDPAVAMATLRKRIEDPREIDDPNVVKVVTDREGDALYFSRHAIPYVAEKRGQTHFPPSKVAEIPSAFPAENASVPFWKRVGGEQFTTSISACMFTGGTFYSVTRPCRPGRWGGRNGWNSCVRWRTATGSEWWETEYEAASG